MNISPEKISTPVAYVVVGFVMIVIGATGVVPIINQSVADSKALFIIIGILLILASLVSVWREQVNQKTTDASSVEQLLNKKSARTKYDIKITFPMNGQTFRGTVGNMVVDVSGRCKPKPLLGNTVRIFVRTQYGYWRQDESLNFDNDGYWTSKIFLWIDEKEPEYDAYIIAAVLDEAGEDMVQYSKKVQEAKQANISFIKLPHYIEKSEEVHVRRERS